MKRTLFFGVVLAMTVASAAAQQVVLARAPQGVLQPIGAPVQTDSFVLANASADRLSVTVSGFGPFTLTPNSFALPGGASMTVKITPNAVTTPFFFAGSITISVGGILSPLTCPVRIAAVNPPASTVKARTPTTQVLTAGLSGLRHQGNWSVSNSGSTTLQGILVSDMPWLVPQQTAVLDVAPHGNAAVTFTIDPKRNAVAPLGALQGTLTLLYATGSSPAVDRVSTTVVDISKVTVLPAEPPAAAPGEVITFLPLVSDPAGATNDIFFANRGTSTLTSDLKFFYTPAESPGSSSLVANPGSLAPSTTAWFPLAPSSLFNFGSGTGSVQVRSDDPDVASAITRSISPDSRNVYATAIPLLRSDRSIGVGDTLVFAGVEKSGAASTDMFLQETAGFAANYTIDFFDATGGVLPGSRNGSLFAFGSVNLRDVAPAGARSARVTNTSTTVARLSGYAAVVDVSTFDEWTIVDTPGATTDLIVPVPTDAPKGSTFSVWITNSASSPVVVAVGADILPVKSRAVRRNPNGVSPIALSMILGAGETREVPISGTPYVRISGPAGAISANGRLTTTVVGKPGAFGTGVPAIPSAFASVANGPETHFFRAIDEVGVAPMTLLLVEAANKPATVRVTVGFSFPAGATLSAHLERSRDFEVAAGQMLAIDDVLTAVATSSRISFGDLADVAIDVQVIGGDGRILSYMESVDDTSGDLTLTPGN